MSRESAAGVNADTGSYPQIYEKLKTVLLPDEGFAKQYNDLALPYLKARREDLELTGSAEEIRLKASYFKADDASGNVLIVHGFTEFIDKYGELIYYFLRFGLNVFMYEQRGHGGSSRQLPDTHLTHVDRFSDYVEDLEKVTASLPQNGLPWYLYCHSMGGGVSALYLEAHSEPLFRRAAMSSPMLSPSTAGLPRWVPEFILGTVNFFGGAKKHFVFSKPYEGREVQTDPDFRSRERFENYQDLKLCTPEHYNNAPTNSWSYQALRITKKILAKGRPESVRIPVRIFFSGHDDTVEEKPVEEFCARLPEAELIRIPGASHEIFMAYNDSLAGYLTELIGFLLLG